MSSGRYPGVIRLGVGSVRCALKRPDEAEPESLQRVVVRRHLPHLRHEIANEIKQLVVPSRSMRRRPGLMQTAKV